VKVKVIECDKEQAENAADELDRTVVLYGDGLDQDILREAGVQETEAVVALTNDDETNILASVLAKRAGASRTLCLINNQNYSPLLETLGIDTFINPRTTTVSTILQHVRRGRIKGLHSIREGAAEVIEAEALETSPLIGKPLRESHLPDGIIVGAVVRGSDFIRPTGNTKIEIGDRVVIFVLRDMVPKVEQMFRVSLEYF
jgi:trk system potassium uptake protein TrkA